MRLLEYRNTTYFELNIFGTLYNFLVLNVL